MNLSAWLRKHLPDRNVLERGHAESTTLFTPSLLSLHCRRPALRKLCFSHTLYCAGAKKKNLNDAFQPREQTARPKIVHMNKNTHLLGGWDSRKCFLLLFPSLLNISVSTFMCVCVCKIWCLTEVAGAIMALGTSFSLAFLLTECCWILQSCKSKAEKINPEWITAG